MLFRSGVRFLEKSLEDVLSCKGAKQRKSMQEEISGKFVMLSGMEARSVSVKDLREYDRARKLLLELGASNVRRAIQTLNSQRRDSAKRTETPGQPKEIQIHKFSDLIADYVAYRSTSGELAESQEKLAEIGKKLMQDVDHQQESRDFKTVFEADLKRISIENFLGVGDLQVIDMDSLPDGIWYIQGPNGSGKSTIAEAITWCLFGQLIRSDTKADFVVNDRSKKNCRVRVDFRNGHSVERFRKFAEMGGSGFRVYNNGEYQEQLDMGDRDAAQTVLEHLLGIDFQSFTRTVALADETARTFVTATPARRRQIVEDLLRSEERRVGKEC